MEPLAYAIIGAAVVVAVSGVGILVALSLNHSLLHRALHYLPSFAAGVFVVIILGLAEEAQHSLTFIQASLLGLGGFLLLAGVSFFIPDAAQGHSEECEHTHGNGRAKARRLFIADGIHNMGDGIILVPAFAASTELGLAVLFGIIVHEAVQELSEFFVYKEAGIPTKEALFKNAISASSIFVGVGIGALIPNHETIEASIIAIAAGSFLFVVIRDLLPHSIARGRKDFFIHIAVGALGVLLMLLVSHLAPHIHEEEDDHDTELHKVMA
jgi:zinc transporter ZupT